MRKPKWTYIPVITILSALLCCVIANSCVNATSTVPPAGSVVVPDDYHTIQEAVDNAPVSGTVFVKSGSYFERVLLTKPLTLLGEDPENTIISISNIPYLVYGAVEIQASDVTISGFTIENSCKGIWTPVDYGAPPRSNCKIINNNIIGNGDGVNIGGQNHVISGNNITGNSEHGISLTASNCIISGNNITGTGMVGVGVGSSNVTVSGNNIVDNGVTRNDVGFYLRGGVMLGSDGPFYVYGNNITDNAGYGIEFAEGCYNSTVYQNNIVRNNVGVYLLNFGVYGDATIGSGNIVYRNNIVDNSQQAVVDKEWDITHIPASGNGTDIVSWDNGKEGNHWSDYTGTDGDGRGTTHYTIDENNKDNHPIINPVTISSTPPPINEQPNDSLQTVVVIAAIATIVLFVVLVVYKAQRKKSNFEHIETVQV